MRHLRIASLMAAVTHKQLFSLALAASLLCCAIPVQAQSVQGLEGLPGSLMDRNIKPFSPLLEGKYTPQTETGVRNAEAKESLIKGEAQPKEQEPEDTQAGSPLTIRIQHIQVEGVTQLTASEITAITTPFENTEKTLSELVQGLIQPLTRLYQEKGLVTSSVYIPPQRLTGGILTIRADEGKVGEVVFENGKHFKARAVLPQVHLEPGKPFKLRRLENSLRRINENPDLQLTATLQAGDNPGETRIVLRTVQDDSPLHFSPFMDNLGRDVIGNNRFGATFTNNNVLGYGDTLHSSFSFTGNSWGNSSGYELPLGKHGTKLGFNYAVNGFDFDQSGFNFQGKGAFYTPYLTQELYRSEKTTLIAELGLGIKNSSLELEGFKLNEDRIRTLTPALSWTRQDNSGRTMLRGEVGIGLNLLNATLANDPTTSRPGAGSQFTRYTGYAVRAQKLPGNTYGVFKAMGQMTPSELVSMEQFQLGGATTVRGYKQGRVIGDSGFLVSAEWHWPLGFLPEAIKLAKWQVPLKNQLELVGFTDFGGVFDNNPFSGVNIQSNRVASSALLGGAGVGLRANLTKKLAARLDMGLPILKLSDNKPRQPQFHFGIESRMF